MTGLPSPDDSASAVVVLRPRGGLVLCALVWAVSAAFLLDAVVRAGLPGLRVLPVLALASALAWALLWAPRVVLRAEEVEVRNVLISHHVPFAAIAAVRLGAMLRIDVREPGPDARVRTITAWNAPGVGRDRPPRPEHTPRPGSAPAAGGPPRRLGPGERLARDQQRSRSAIVVRRWEERADAASREADPARAGDTPPGMTTRANTLVLAILSACVIAVAVPLAL